MMKLFTACVLLAGAIVYFTLAPIQMGASPATTAGVASAAAQGQSKGTAEAGKEVFEQCGVCHAADTDEKKMGPSLKGLYKKEKLKNGKKPTDETVRAVIKAGGNGMPEYAEILSAEEMDNLLAYLRTL